VEVDCVSARFVWVDTEETNRVVPVGSVIDTTSVLVRVEGIVTVLKLVSTLSVTLAICVIRTVV
jgi:hypothetical protein